MFEAGKRYNFKTVEHDGHSTWNATVDAVEGPLLKLREHDREWIFNTHASSFESAKLNPDENGGLADLTIELTDREGETSLYNPRSGQELPA